MRISKPKLQRKPFPQRLTGDNEAFDKGTIIVPAGIQTARKLAQIFWPILPEDSHMPLLALDTGLTTKGIDLGSRSFRPVSAPKVLMVGGKGVSQYEAGEILYYLDNLLEIPVTVVEMERLAAIDFS